MEWNFLVTVISVVVIMLYILFLVLFFQILWHVKPTTILKWFVVSVSNSIFKNGTEIDEEILESFGRRKTNEKKIWFYQFWLNSFLLHVPIEYKRSYAFEISYYDRLCICVSAASHTFATRYHSNGFFQWNICLLYLLTKHIFIYT